jgi:hypothetical protein
MPQSSRVCLEQSLFAAAAERFRHRRQRSSGDLLRSTNVMRALGQAHSTVTDLARLRGLSTSVPRASAV